MMDLNGILKNLPHAFPFRMIDRILEIEKGRKAIALKNVSILKKARVGKALKTIVKIIFLLIIPCYT
jgi:3-hydroxymyristoyl/3-hydroxydecanoyl-(acyl carrier protein) dehydratase